MRGNGTAIWQGFEVTWLRTPHRLNRLGSWLEDIEHDEAGTRGTARARLTVGRVPDRGRARTWVAAFSAPDVCFVDAELEVELGAGVGREALHRGGPVTHPLMGAAPGASTVVLRGFELACTSHPAGVHTQGLGMRIAELRIGRGALSFVPEILVHANNSPDPLTTWSGEYRYRVRMFYTVILGAPGALVASPRHDDEACASIAHASERPPLLSRRTQGRPGFENGVTALRGFWFQQRGREGWRRDGRYLRQLEARVEDRAYDPNDGSIAWHPRCWFSNSGLVRYPVRAEHHLWTTLLQFRDPARVRRETIEQGVGWRGGDELATRFAFDAADPAVAGGWRTVAARV